MWVVVGLALARWKGRHSLFAQARIFGQLAGHRADDGRHGERRGREDLARGRRKGDIFILEGISIGGMPQLGKGWNDSLEIPRWVLVRLCVEPGWDSIISWFLGIGSSFRGATGGPCCF